MKSRLSIFMVALTVAMMFNAVTNVAFADEGSRVSDRDVYESLPGRATPTYDPDTGVFTGWVKSSDGITCVKTPQERYYCDYGG